MANLIKKIEMNHFRGASRPSVIEFDPTKNTVVIFGENGHGKSTIVDAIDMVANGMPGSLADRPSTSTKQHLPSVDSNYQDLSVKLYIDGMEWEASLDGSTIHVSGDSPCPTVHILRRNQLLRLIETQPAQRYEALRRFVNVDGVEQSEQYLRDCVRETNAELASLSRQVTDAQNELEKLWKDEGSPSDSWLKWAHEKSQVDISETKTLATYLTSVIDSINTAIGSKDRFDTSFSDYQVKCANLKAVEEEIKSRPGLSAEEAIKLLNILQQTQTYISETKEPVTECPVCEQPVVFDQLTNSIQERLTSMTEIKDLDERKKAGKRQLQGSESTLSTDSKQLLRQSQNVIRIVSENKHLDVPELVIDVEKYAGLSKDELDNKGKNRLCVELVGIINRCISALKSRHTELQKDIHQHNAIKNHYDKLVGCLKSTSHVEKVLAALQKALDIIHSKRIDFTQGILDEVADEWNRLYRRIHPNEPLGNCTLSLDPDRRHSLHQGAEFEGHQGVPPQAYFSDSHLDTLGFCVWLSIAKRGTPQDTIIVLDDIFTSADSVHLRNIVELLTEEAENFSQVVMTTHYRQWRDRYRYMQSASGNVHLIELHRWSLEKGVRACNSKLVLEELREALGKEPFDRQDVASRAGILLESILDTLALQYGCKTRHTRNDDHTLMELSNACSRLFGRLQIGKSPQLVNAPLTKEQVREAVEENFTITCPLDIFSKIKDSSFVRNQVGCHYNISGMEISDEEVEKFGDDILSLAIGITCQNCGTLPGRNRGTHFGCPCGLTKLMPLTV
jgi:energy-coupling factor transporter ATP-binding protein EcfA2